ncbi:MAG: hypothetical protein ACQER4_08450 [Bacteroidota bacterium]
MISQRDTDPGLQQIDRLIQKLKTRILRFRKEREALENENRSLRERIRELEKEKRLGWSDMDGSDKIQLKQKIDHYIQQIDQHLKND